MSTSVVRQNPDVAVIGGGVIGLATAWRLARQGARVQVLERDTVIRAASRASAAMVAPIGSVEPVDPFLRLRTAGAAAWPGFAAELAEETGDPAAYHPIGSLLVAFTPEDVARTRELADFHAELGIRTREVGADQLYEIEPRLAAGLPGGLFFPDDGCVDPEALGRSLVSAIRGRGGEVCERTEVATLRLDGDRVVGLETTAGERVDAGTVLVAAGAWSGRLPGIPAEAALPLRAVKGQSVYVRAAEPDFLATVLRAGSNIVPRGDGRILLAGTVETASGFDTRPTVAGLVEVLGRTTRAVPDLAGLEVVAHTVGLRPVGPDDAPILGPSGVDGLWWATGHSYYGVLLAPVTADRVALALAGSDPAARDGLAAFAPTRFGADSGPYESRHG